tara:strand:+ start:135 stop:761 length:627 start_codon:yes stop_codon:yes gene_type:complete
MINRNYLNSNVLPLRPPASPTAYGQLNDIPHPSNTIYSTPLIPSAYDGVVSITLPVGFGTGVTTTPGKIPLGLEVGDVVLNVDYSSVLYGSYTAIAAITGPDTFDVQPAPFIFPGDLSAILIFKPGCRGGAIFEIPNGFTKSTTDIVTVETIGGITQTIFNGRGPYPFQMPLCRKLLFQDDNASLPSSTRTQITQASGVPGYLLAFYN